MKKFLVVFFTVVFTAGIMVFSGCGGGGGTKVNSAADEEGQVMDEASQKSKEELPTTYIVEAGDTLATIAEKAAIYGNKYQWPLIFDANKDILDNYRTIQEGQKLIIPRNVSAVEIEAAKQRAQELNWPPSGSKLAAKGKEAKEDTGEEGSVAGMGTKKGSSGLKTAQNTSGEGTQMGTEEQPTPISEPGKKNGKKGGSNIIMLLLILLGVIAVIIWFLMSQKKKKDEEEDKEDKSDNILG
jgi:LysM repeat protein